MTTTHIEWNQSEAEAARPHRADGVASPALKPMWQSFDEVAARQPGSIAVTCGEERLTYGELREQADRLAVHLRGWGVGPESLVGVYLERSTTAIVALLAILKAGGAYLPIDPAYPGERVMILLEDARPSLLLTEEGLRGRLPAHEARVICLGRNGDVAAGGDVEPDLNGSVLKNPAAPICQSGLDNLAYVIYTSGSTGKPKGVMVTHGNAARLLTATEPWFHFYEQDVWTLFHSVAFDFSVWEIWGCLLTGGRLVVVPFAVSRSPEDFYELLRVEQVTVLNQTPSAFYQLIAVDQARPGGSELALRVVVFGGEALNFGALQPWFARHGDTRPRLINMYGITETTVHVTYREVTAAEAAGGSASLIGVPIPDLKLYLLDDSRKPVAEGEVGEIYVGGAGVARGYLNRPELNAERFLPDTFSGEPGARLYKSGDLARYLPGGELEYLGRGDGQVKIQGFRIELGEVEAAIVGYPRIREARVIAHTDAAGNKRLVAYYVAQAGEATKLPAQEISKFLAAKLPPWMMPAVYVAIEAFPLTAHGKVDYAALPAPIVGSTEAVTEPETGETGRNESYGTGSGTASGTSLEHAVAGAWKQVLGADHVGLDDNFFDIGGTSLLLVQVHAKLQSLLNKKIPVADLFAHTTVRSLAGQLGGSATPAASGAWQSAQNQAQKQRAAFARARAMKKATL